MTLNVGPPFKRIIHEGFFINFKFFNQCHTLFKFSHKRTCIKYHMVFHANFPNDAYPRICLQALSRMIEIRMKSMPIIETKFVIFCILAILY
jgi:hypothetical protein